MTNSATAFAGTLARDPYGARFWTARAVEGLVVGAAIAALDFLYYSALVSAPNAIGLGPFLSSLAIWSGECVLFALAIAAVEWFVQPAGLRVWQLVLAIAAGIAVSVVLWHAFCLLVLRDALGIPLFRDRIGQPGSWIATMLYHAWLMLFFGALIAAVVASQRSRTRMLSALRSAELARATSQHGLAQAKLASLEARVDPDFLYQSLSRLESLYEHDPPAADRVLDELIVFLRNALNDAKVSRIQEAP